MDSEILLSAKMFNKTGLIFQKALFALFNLPIILINLVNDVCPQTKYLNKKLKCKIPNSAKDKTQNR